MPHQQRARKFSCTGQKDLFTLIFFFEEINKIREKENTALKSQFGISKNGRGGRRTFLLSMRKDIKVQATPLNNHLEKKD